MDPVTSSQAKIRVNAQNIGGIDETTVELSPGVTVLSGRNATNRTSFLQAIMAGIGSDSVSLKADADEGHVRLEIGDETYTRTLRRQNGTVVTEGDPYLDDPELADLFAFLLESNEARRSVARGDNLRDLIMRPVDIEEIKAEIHRLDIEKRQIDDQLSGLEERSTELSKLEQRRAQLDAKIEEKRSELADKEAEIESADLDVDESREDEAELEAKLDELRDVRSTLEEVRYDLDTERESIDSLREERAELEAERESLPDAPVGQIEEIDAQIDRLRDHKQSLESTINQLRNVIQFNEGLIEDDRPEFINRVLEGADDDESPTAQLLPENDSIVCWTCGSETERQDITDTLDQLRDLQQEKIDERNSITTELDELKAERTELVDTQRQREDVERKLDGIDAEISDRERTIDELEARRADLETEIEDLEAEVEALEQAEYSELLDLHREANQLEFEVRSLENQREEVDAEIERIEEQLEGKASLEERRAEINEELTDLRTRIEGIEDEAVQAFNEHMQNVLEILEYANIERIWIERSENRVREGRQTVTKSVFDLHIVRSTSSGTTYEDTIDHLSESEREVTGLVFALAGYLVHDVHETAPVMLLDSLEALDSERIAALIEYFEEYADFVIAALLPEDAAAVEDQAETITQL